MAWSYSPKEFIKMYRKFMKWEWYTDTNTKSLFIHCLLKANWKSGTWQGIHFDAGELITSLPSLSEETGLTVRQVRTSLNRLISTGELTSRTTDKVTGKKLTKNRIITINNWGSYQGIDRQNDRQNDSQTDRQATGKRQASDSRYKNIKNNKNIKKEKEEPAAPSSSTSQDNENGIDLWNDEAAWEEAIRNGHI